MKELQKSRAVSRVYQHTGTPSIQIRTVCATALWYRAVVLLQDYFRGSPGGPAGMHAGKGVAPGQLLAPSKGGAYTHHYMHAAPPTGFWGPTGTPHGMPDAGNLFVPPPGQRDIHLMKGAPQFAMHAPPPGSVAGAAAQSMVRPFTPPISAMQIQQQDCQCWYPCAVDIPCDRYAVVEYQCLTQSVC